MPDYGLPRYRDATRTQWRLRIAGATLLISAALLFFAVRFKSKAYLTATPARHISAQYVRLWFDAADDLIGAHWAEGRLIIERLPGANPAASWRFAAPSGPAPGDLWAFAADDSRLAWISKSPSAALHWQGVAPADAPSSVALSGANPLALTLLSDRTAAVIFDDLTVQRWDTATGRNLGPWRAPIPQADRAAAEGDYIAFSSRQEGKLFVFASQGQQWIEVQSSLSPELPDRVVLPAPSVAGTMIDGRLRIAGITLSSPGPIRSVAAHLYDVIAAGDFGGIYVLPPQGEYYRLADARPDSLVACGESKLAVSGADGTTLFNLGSENRLTPVGRAISLGSLGGVLLAAILASWSLLLEAFAILFSIASRRPLHRAVAPSRLGDPPPDLIRTCAGGQMTLWAGAGLSAQSGFPLRADFIAGIVQAAALEFADAGLARTLKSLVASGKGEMALDQLVAELTEHRGAILAHFTSVFARFAAPSRSHELLAHLNFPRAVTTNYDILLEQTCACWAANLITPGGDRPGERFLWKLYGSLAAPSSVLLSQAEFQQAADRPNLESLREIFDAHPTLFVGCSLDGLLRDLKTLRISGEATQVRYAIAGVSGAWQRTAAELARRYGIQVLPCAEDRIGEALPAFLDTLVRRVREAPKEGVRSLTLTQT